MTFDLWILLVWLIASSILFFAFRLSEVRWDAPRPMVVIAVVAAVARLVPIALWREQPLGFATDINNYARVAHEFIAGRDVYAIADGAPLYLHPYLPMQMYILALCSKLADVLPLSFFVIVRMPQVAADAGIALLVYAASLRLRGDRGRAFNDGLSYAVCPFPLFITAYHGQFDAISTFCALAAWYCFVIATDRTPRMMALSALLLGLGILDKTWPLVLLPVFLFHLGSLRERARYLATAVAVPAAATAAYLALHPGSAGNLWERTTGYSAPGFDGQTLVLTHLGNVFAPAASFGDWEVHHGIAVLGVALVATAIVVIPRTTPLTGVIAMIIAFLVATTSGGGNHLFWLVPFAILAGPRWLLLPFIATTVILAVFVGFIGCGIYCGVLTAPYGHQMAKYVWIVYVLEWSILALWGAWLWVAARGPRPRARPEEQERATLASRPSSAHPAL